MNYFLQHTFWGGADVSRRASVWQEAGPCLFRLWNDGQTAWGQANQSGQTPWGCDNERPIALLFLHGLPNRRDWTTGRRRGGLTATLALTAETQPQSEPWTRYNPKASSTLAQYPVAACLMAGGLWNFSDGHIVFLKVKRSWCSQLWAAGGHCDGAAEIQPWTHTEGTFSGY